MFTSLSEILAQCLFRLVSQPFTTVPNQDSKQEYSLRERLERSMLSSIINFQKFIPRDTFESIMTLENISKEL